MMNTNSVDFFRTKNYTLPQNLAAPIIVAWKLKTPENYGNLIRLADTVGCSKVVFVNDDIQITERKIKKTAGDSYVHMNFEFISEDRINAAIPSNYHWVAVETAENSENIFNDKLPEAVALFVGNEQKGIPENFLAKMERIVHIPLTGRCTSLNVSHATAVALFEWVRQYL